MIVVEIHTSHVIETYTPRTACSFRAVVSRGARAVAGESGIGKGPGRPQLRENELSPRSAKIRLRV